MAQARLNALRAQRQGGPAPSPSLASPPGHELSTFPSAPALDSTAAFLDEASSIQSHITAFSTSVARIGTLGARTLDAVDDAAAARARAELDALVADTRAQSQEIKRRVQRLHEAILVPGGSHSRQDAEMRRNRATYVRQKFVEALQRFQQVEREQRAKARMRVERQIRIVKADATQAEIDQAIASGEGGQVFMQALSQSANYAEARSAYSEVQGRAQDLRKLEETMAELAQLFVDMDVLVNQQDDTLVAIENNAIEVERHAAEATEQVGIAVRFAEKARKKRWICFCITVVVIIVLAIVLAIVFGKK
ncbi:Syntaxin-like protein [Mycena kentingensis (nom. inval.)]|nr:Syntaxin-like protein [Mycena kentingensis (nom. inval.)]